MFTAAELSQMVRRVVRESAARKRRLRGDRKLRARFEQLEGRVLLSTYVQNAPLYNCGQTGNNAAPDCGCPPQTIGNQLCRSANFCINRR